MQVVKTFSLPAEPDSSMWLEQPFSRRPIYRLSSGLATERLRCSRDIFLICRWMEAGNLRWSSIRLKTGILSGRRMGRRSFLPVIVLAPWVSGRLTWPMENLRDFPSWSKRILANSTGLSVSPATDLSTTLLNTGMQDIYIAEFDPAAVRIKGTPKRLASRYVGANMWPAWSPDGKYLAYNRQRGRRVFGPGYAGHCDSLRGDRRGAGDFNQAQTAPPGPLVPGWPIAPRCRLSGQQQEES